MPPVVIPACTVPASRSYDGLDHILAEQEIAYRKQPRRCTWCAIEFVPKQPSGSFRGQFCGKSCSGRANQSRQTKTSHLREVILEQIGRLTPRMSGELHKRVQAVWGEVSDRAVLRCLAQLRNAGRVQRTPDGYLLAPTPHQRAAGATT